MRTLVNKGDCVCLYNVMDKNGNHLSCIEIVVGEDILNSNEDEEYYDECQGKMVIEFELVADAVYDYMESNYPNVTNYDFTIED